MTMVSEFEIEVLEQLKKSFYFHPWLILINIIYIFNQWNRCIYYFNFEEMVESDNIPWTYKLFHILSGIFALLAGILSDLYGRRIVALILSVLWMIFAIAQVVVIYFVEDEHMYDFALTLGYASSQALIVPVFVNFVELMPIRLRILGTLDMCWDYTAVLFMRLIAHLIHIPWYREVIFTFCVLFVLLANWYIPESPFWLMNKGKISRLFSVVKDVTGKRPTDIVQPPDEESTVHKCKIVRSMFAHLFKREWKYFVYCICLTAVCSGMRSDAKWKIDFDKAVPFPKLAILLNSCTLPLLLICYFIFGIRLGLVTILFFLFVLNLAEMVTLVTNSAESVHNHPFQYLLADASGTILHLYVVEIFPTYVRATLFAIVQVVALTMRLFVTILNVNKLATNYVFYTFRTIFPLVGLIPMVMPETRKSYLPNKKVELSTPSR